MLKKTTSVVRVLQNDFNVPPERMTAAGRSYYIPVADNETAEGQAKNRRTRIVVLPKLDQFYDLIEQGITSNCKLNSFEFNKKGAMPPFFILLIFQISQTSVEFFLTADFKVNISSNIIALSFNILNNTFSKPFMVNLFI